MVSPVLYKPTTSSCLALPPEIAAEELERRITTRILDDAPIGNARLDAGLTCLAVNHEFVEMVGAADKTDLVGRSISEIAPSLPTTVLKSVLASGQPCRLSAHKVDTATGNAANPRYWDWAVWPVKTMAGAASGWWQFFPMPQIACCCSNSARILSQR